jgi:hypothetical protein
VTPRRSRLGPIESDQEATMKTKIALIALAIAVATPAWAGDDDQIRALAEQSGLSVRKVQMLLGNRTPFAEYTRSYDRSLRKFKAAIGEAEYRQLISGQPIELKRNRNVRTLVAQVDEKPAVKSP